MNELINPEFIKALGTSVIYPLIAFFTALTLAKFHFEKDIKTKYLFAKDKVATDITNQTCLLLQAMWAIVNIDAWIAAGDKNPELPQRRQKAIIDFHTAIGTSYPILGTMGIYYGPKIVDEISMLQSKLNDMVNNNDYKAFGDWDNFRKKEILPVLDMVHKELKYTVFDRPPFDLPLASFASAVSGLIASFYFIKGTLALTQEKILQADGGFLQNTGLSAELASQKIDFTIGAFLLLISFILQIFVIYKNWKMSDT